MKLSKRILWVTDGGSGVIKTLKERFGKKLIHQRCTIHKDRNIQRHLPKRYRKTAHRRFKTALEQNSYDDAKKMLKELECWLRDINDSAANSLIVENSDSFAKDIQKEETGMRTMITRVTIILTVAMLCLSCRGTELSKEISSSKSSMKCPGMYDVQVTYDYWGNHEGHTDPIVNHASAAELVYSELGPPSKERFAVAWIRYSDRNVFVKRYDTSIPGFWGDEQQLNTGMLPANWVQRLGFDEDCVGISGVDEPCAWFAWESEEIQYRAVGANEVLGEIHSFDGHQPSGDTGVVQGEHKKLLSYITPGRKQVKAKLLDHFGEEILEVTLRTLTEDWNAYQTSVAWSSNEDRWLVAWTEDVWPIQDRDNGMIKTRIVKFDGSLGATVNHVMYCDGNVPWCNGGVGDDIDAYNPSCICKGLWLSSSWYSTPTDRYRLHQYSIHARLDYEGIKTAVDQYANCSVYCPITEASFYYPQGHTPFQQLIRGFSPTLLANHTRLIEDSFYYVEAGDVFAPPYYFSQAFKSNGSVAIALATDGETSTGMPGLRLSIVDVRPGGCP
ncbi:MAG: transposase [Pseudomonadota bacterium]